MSQFTADPFQTPRHLLTVFCDGMLHIALHMVCCNKTKYFRLRLSYQVRLESCETGERHKRDLKETWARMMKIESSRQTWTIWANKQTYIVTPWAPDGANKAKAALSECLSTLLLLRWPWPSISLVSGPLCEEPGTGPVSRPRSSHLEYNLHTALARGDKRNKQNYPLHLYFYCF